MSRTKVLFAKGFSMGVADVVPGVSGGTIALVLGIYTELIDTIKNIQLHQVDELLRNVFFFWRKDNRKKFFDLCLAMNMQFLVPIVAGIVFAILIASYIIPPLLQTYPKQMDSLFLGLILASIAIPLSMIHKKTLATWCVILFFAWVAYELVSIPKVDMSGSLYFTFFSGAIAICAMILPGISGSYILQAMGQYEYILNNLHLALKLDVGSLVIITVFISGIILGITSFARLLSWTLHHYHMQTLAALTGLMLGALRAVWPFRDEQTENLLLPTRFGSEELVCLFLFVVGLSITGLLFLFDKRSKKIL